MLDGFWDWAADHPWLAVCAILLALTAASWLWGAITSADPLSLG